MIMIITKDMSLLFWLLQNSKLPEVPAFVFMIDVTYQSVKTGMVHLLCQEMSKLLDVLPR